MRSIEQSQSETVLLQDTDLVKASKISVQLKASRSLVGFIFLIWKRFLTTRTPKILYLSQTEEGRRALVKEATKNSMVTLVCCAEGYNSKRTTKTTGLTDLSFMADQVFPRRKNS